MKPPDGTQNHLNNPPRAQGCSQKTAAEATYLPAHCVVSAKGVVYPPSGLRRQKDSRRHRLEVRQFLINRFLTQAHRYRPGCMDEIVRRTILIRSAVRLHGYLLSCRRRLVGSECYECYGTPCLPRLVVTKVPPPLTGAPLRY